MTKPRRLRLVSEPSPVADLCISEVAEAPRGSVAVADAADGQHAIGFARALANALCEADRPPWVLLMAFGQEPASGLLDGLDPRCDRAFLAVAQADDVRSFVQRRAPPAASWVCVGPCALLALSGALRVWIAPAAPGEPRDPLQRALSARGQLRLFEPRRSFPAVLARALIVDGAHT